MGPRLKVRLLEPGTPPAVRSWGVAREGVMLRKSAARVPANADHNGFQLTINRKGSIVGMIGLHYIDHEHQKTSIGYWIAQAYQKQGIVVRSCQALIDYCVQELALTTIEISCATHNLKSQTIPKRLGFKKVKTVENAENLYGTMVDHHIFIFKK